MARKIVLLDLDGTLFNTTGRKFKDMKDGKIPTVTSEISFSPQAKKFLEYLKNNSYVSFIISDSHPKYVNKIYDDFLAPYCDGVLSLADKPNAIKTIDFLKQKQVYPLDPNNTYFIGDTWLDIYLGRILNVPTIYSTALTPEDVDPVDRTRDGIGDNDRQLKAGPTFVAEDFSEIQRIISRPVDYLLALESVFNGSQSNRSVKIKTNKVNDRQSIIRALARQTKGESDQYAVSEVYYEFSRPDRRVEVIKKTSDAVLNYLEFVFAYRRISWHLLTWMPDKKTTVPRNKMSELINYIQPHLPEAIDVEQVFRWSDSVNSSIRNVATRTERKDFVLDNVFLQSNTELRNKNVVVIDDQYTTGATADVIINLLRDAGVKNVLFIALFYLAEEVASIKQCPKCGKLLKLKINRAKSNKFYSCVSPKYGGDGCGYTENIDE